MSLIPQSHLLWRYFERDAIVERQESADCVSTPAPSSSSPLPCPCLYALGTAAIPPQDGEV